MFKLDLGGGEDHDHDKDSRVRLNAFFFELGYVLQQVLLAHQRSCALYGRGELRGLLELAPMGRSKDIVSDMMRGLHQLACFYSLRG